MSDNKLFAVFWIAVAAVLCTIAVALAAGSLGKQATIRKCLEVHTPAQCDRFNEAQ